MRLETEQACGTLELLTDKLSFDLPGHEDGGYIYPFVWDKASKDEFNIFNLCEENSWLKLTDRDRVIKSWQQLEYARYFNDFSLNSEQIKIWESNIDSLEPIIQTLDNLEAYLFQNTYGSPPNIILGQIEDNSWIGIAPTIYVETNVPHEIIARYIQYDKNTASSSGEKVIEFDKKVKAIISRLGKIELNGDFGGGYIYSYTHKIVYSFGATKKLAFKNTIQKTGMLEVSKFDGLYRDRQYLKNWSGDPNIQITYQKYARLNQFIDRELNDVMVYRISSWIAEHIYIIGQMNQGDRVGLYLKSFFVYNP